MGVFFGIAFAAGWIKQKENYVPIIQYNNLEKN
jgi:hypothetical protein